MSSTTLVISDVHANPWALEAVLSHAEQFNYDEIWFLGDLWGYGPKPYEVWEKLFSRSEYPTVALAGNHDWEICEIPSGPIRPDARAVIDDHRQFLKRRPSVIKSVESLPVMCSPRPGVYLAHGEVMPTCAQSIRSWMRHPMDSPQKIAENFSQALEDDGKAKVTVTYSECLVPAQVFAIGQTHEQKLWEWEPGQGVWHEKLAREHSLSNLDGRPVGFNPGSVGFPRADSGCPGYAIINWDTNMLFFQRVMYDTTKLKQAMAYPPYQALIKDPRFFIEPYCQEAK
jgi:hypothetical protein